MLSINRDEDASDTAVKVVLFIAEIYTVLRYTLTRMGKFLKNGPKCSVFSPFQTIWLRLWQRIIA